MPPGTVNKKRCASETGDGGKPDPSICPICELRPHVEHSIYCFECGKFLLHKKEAAARAVAMKNAKCFDPPGFRCDYTGRMLELYDTKSPYYASFDHRTPGKNGDLVMCVRWINSMKGPLSEEEFWPVVLALDDTHFNGKPFPIELTWLKYWRGNTLARSRLPVRLPLGQNAEFCGICGAKPPPRTKYCARCGGFVYKAGENLAQVAAMKRVCRKGDFYCEYTGLPMNDSDPQSPLYMEFDHPTPEKKGRLKAVVAFVNRMKTDLSEAEFWKVIRELARFRRKGGTFRDVIKFQYWFRMARQRRNG